MAEQARIDWHEAADLSACAREPIHAPGLIQPQGCLLVLDPGTLRVRQAAIGPAMRRLVHDAPVGRALDEVLPDCAGSLLARVRAGIEPGATLHLGQMRVPGETPCDAILHRSDDGLILELEAGEAEDPASFDDVYPSLQGFIAALQAEDSVEGLGALAAREVRRITGFDRVLVYRFDPQWNGTVIAEDGNGVLPSYMGLRFPAADIPAQARTLYRLNRLRLIADAGYTPIPIEPALDPDAHAPVDLSLAVLRSVSPVHLEYMRNMGTDASMSISLLVGGELWGLIACHNKAPHRVAYTVRNACDFLGQILALQIAAREQAGFAERRIALRSVQGRLLARMALEEHFADGLAGDPDDLLGLTHANGAAILLGDRCLLVGATPSEAEVRRIVRWLSTRDTGDIYATDRLAEEMPGAEAWKACASGLLAASVSRLHDSYVLWFRPEAVRTVRWGGSPLKPGEVPEGARIHPRKSFEAWKETVRLRSTPWDEAEIDAATLLRSAIVDIVLRKAEEMAALNEQLVRSNRELEAFSYSVSHDLRAPFRHIVGYSQLLMQNEGKALTDRGRRYIDTIVESAKSAGELVDDLLSFSQMGRAMIHPIEVDMTALVDEVWRSLEQDRAGRAIEWTLAPLPPAWADASMMRLVIQNLLENALKFTRERTPARIEVGSQSGAGGAIYFVKDNGAGFDMAYVGKLFGVFQRLHRSEDFEGTGIGLANVKRIVEQRHGGRVWAEGEVGMGATLSFSLPPRFAEAGA